MPRWFAYESRQKMFSLVKIHIKKKQQINKTLKITHESTKENYKEIK